MAGLFIDTWGWLALRDKGERQHREAAAAFNAALTTGGTVVTTDYVLDEAITLLFRRLSAHKASESVDSLMAAILGGSVVLAPVNSARFDAALKLRLKYRDKPEISFTDFTSLVVMQELRLETILTEDRHFAQVGMGLRLVPGV